MTIQISRMDRVIGVGDGIIDIDNQYTSPNRELREVSNGHRMLRNKMSKPEWKRNQTEPIK